ncbi:cytochrome P450 [Circinella umbellata]|nr:cytochrome P450 [Circinella umbellata]
MFQRLCQQHEEFELENEDLYQASGDTLVAGTETTIDTMLSTIALLLHHPDVRKRLGDKVDRFIKTHGRLPKFSGRDQFPHMISVQKESIRYRPVLHLALSHSLDRNELEK